MKKLIECIPNFSEGRDENKINAIIKAITDVSGIILLDSESDPAHNRSVVTFAGEPESVIEAAFQGCKKAAELIDLDKHKGEHPRMGATDVIPLVPLSGIKEDEAIKYAEKLGEKIGKELKIPVYLYEKAARHPQNANLANIRKGEYETIKKEITKPERKPDFGPLKVGKAGVVAVGMRDPLVAYNVNLNTKDLEIAQDIAKKIRFKDGGFKCVKALGFALEDRSIVQVSMNLTNYKVTPPYVVFEAIKKEAIKHGVKIIESEVIGLIPERALVDTAKYYLQLDNFKYKQILENRIQKKMEASRLYLDEFLDNVASRNPIPGGGSVSALSGALSAALISMVANLTLANKKYEKNHKDMEKLLKKSEALRADLYRLIQEDADAYKKVVEAYKTKNNTEIQKAMKNATTVPLQTAQTTISLLDLIKTISTKGNKNASSDCGVALLMAQAAIKGALLNVEINLPFITDKKFVSEMGKKCKKIKTIVNHLAT